MTGPQDSGKGLDADKSPTKWSYKTLAKKTRKKEKHEVSVNGHGKSKMEEHYVEIRSFFWKTMLWAQFVRN